MGGLKIALDATYSSGARPSGVGVYCRELMLALAKLPEARQSEWLWCYRIGPWWRGRHSEAAAPLHCSRRLFTDWWVPSCRLFHGLNQRLPSSARARRMVATFHDVFVMNRVYSDAPFRERMAKQAEHAARAADALIAVSAFTADQVAAELNVPRSRIRVVPHGVRDIPLPGGVTRERIILTVGAIQTRKNTLALVRAFERLPKGWRLVLAGAERGFGAGQVHEAIAASPRRADIEVTGWVDDVQLNALYARASLFAFPSLDEGFGIPVLEAMSVGLPVLASNVSALPEVCGDGAMLVDPSAEAIEAGLRLLMEDDTLRADLTARGRARAAAFTWERAARETWALYADLVGG